MVALLFSLTPDPEEIIDETMGAPLWISSKASEVQKLVQQALIGKLMVLDLYNVSDVVVGVIQKDFVHPV